MQVVAVSVEKWNRAEANRERAKAKHAAGGSLHSRGAPAPAGERFTSFLTEF